MKDALKPGLIWHIVHKRGGVALADKTIHNFSPDEGLDWQVAENYVNPTWYCGLIQDPFTAVFDVTDTAARITILPPSFPTTNGWQEEALPGRQQLTFTNGVSGSGTATSDLLLFVMQTTGSLAGGFVCDKPTPGPNAGGILLSEMFDNSVPQIDYAPGDTIQVTIIFQLLPPPT